MQINQISSPRARLGHWLPIALTILNVGALSAADAPKAAANPAKLDADYAIQGEYAGELDTEPWGVQLVALGGGKFEGVGFAGGLPGAGWDGDRSTIVRGTGELVDGVVRFMAGAGRFTGTIKDGVLSITESGSVEVGTLKRLVRKSPTEGEAPPAGAIVLFDGKNVDAWRDGAKMTDDGLLIAGATSRQEFQNFRLHLEFRTPYKPAARGQDRGNSGAYAQGRYEVQVLDSFGLAGENNEAGGIYSVAAPSVNMCLPPLQWQTYDIDFTAAEFDASGKKTKDATMTVRHNGVVVQEGTKLPRATAAAPLGEGSTPGPLYLQDHGNPVHYRNVWIVPK
ncbi:MAG: DUF1080 domain-containing protein [Verrucomicrobiales bacterium]